MIELRYCGISSNGLAVITAFADGTFADAIPHDTHHYHVISHRLGYGDDIMRYTLEHEFSHSFIEERLHNRPSRVLWGVAHNQMLTGPEAAYEEMMAQAFQRWLRAGERPIVGGVDWDTLKNDALRLLDAD